MMMDEWWFGNDLDGINSDVIQTLFQHLSGGAGEYHEEPQSGKRCSFRDSNPVPSKYKSRALSLDQAMWFDIVSYYQLLK
jgi:hypothetical protein